MKKQEDKVQKYHESLKQVDSQLTELEKNLKVKTDRKAKNV